MEADECIWVGRDPWLPDRLYKDLYLLAGQSVIPYLSLMQKE